MEPQVFQQTTNSQTDAELTSSNLLAAVIRGQVLLQGKVKACHISAYQCTAVHRQNTLLVPALLSSCSVQEILLFSQRQR